MVRKLEKYLKRGVALILMVPLIASANYESDSGKSESKESREKEAIANYLKNNLLQPSDYLMLAGKGTAPDRNKEDFLNFLDDLNDKKAKKGSDYRFLRHLFYKVHHKYLRRYEEFTSFSQVFEEGKYNCLTGTAFFALALDHLGYDYKIVENTYHIYLIIDTKERQYLFESTDPFNGFIYDKKEIKERLEAYRLNELQHNGFQFTSYTHNQVDLYQLVGLHYYNSAINYYNKKDVKSAFIALNKALIFYKSDRLMEFMHLILDGYKVPVNTRQILLSSR